MGEGEGSGAGNPCPGLLYGFLWFLLIFPAWWLAFIIAWFYVFLLPFSGCIKAVKPATEGVLKVIQLPMTCAENMVAMKPLC